METTMTIHQALNSVSERKLRENGYSIRKTRNGYMVFKNRDVYFGKSISDIYNQIF